MRKYENNQKTLKNIKKYKTHGKTKKYQKSKNVGWGKKVGVNPRYLICLITWSGSKLRIMLRLTPFSLLLLLGVAFGVMHHITRPIRMKELQIPEARNS